MKYGITREELEEIGQLKGIEVGAALHRLHKFYCVPLRMKGLCSRQCVKDCGERVRGILETPGDNREATFTWACREAVANAVETGPEEVRDGRPGNVFDRLVNLL